MLPLKKLPIRVPLKAFHINRRLVQDSLVVGAALTIMVVLLDLAGALTPLERWLYDRRAYYCQFFSPPPTDTLVHLDVDDNTLDSVGAWPWQRSTLAEIFDEIALAGPKALAIDVLFPEPQKVELRKRPDGTLYEVDHDAALAASLQNLGSAIIAVDTPFNPPDPPLNKSLVEILSANAELPSSTATDLLKKRGFTQRDAADAVLRFYDVSRREGILDRILVELNNRPRSEDELRRTVLVTDPSPYAPLFDAQFRIATNIRAVRDILLPINPTFPPPYETSLSLTPIKPLTVATRRTATITYPRYSDGVVRSVPLFVASDGKMIPQLGLALACQMMGTKLQDIRYVGDSLVIPRAGKPDLKVPVRSLYSAEQRTQVPLLVDIPWFGGHRWEYMYDPKRMAPAQHLSLNVVWGIVEARRKIAQNIREIDAALLSLIPQLGKDELEKFQARKLAPDDFSSRKAIIEWVKGEIAPTVEDINVRAATRPSDLDPSEKIIMLGQASLDAAVKQVTALEHEVPMQRARLRAELNGRAAILGFIGTGLINDKVTTSLHSECPGVMIHGIIYSSLITGELWRALPGWLTPLSTLVLGAITATTAARFPPSRALLSAVLLAIIFLLINWLLLFDYGNMTLGAAAPLVAIGTVWSGCTLARLILERYERALITKKFRNYVDPKLVDYYLKHPEQVKFEGQTREMTVVFTDLGNFTALTAKLGEQTVPLLNDFLARMVPVIRSNNGYVNKFLGDGIMFFYGAPEPSPMHARDAIATVLQMQSVLAEFNQGLVESGLPPVTLRAGVSTGHMIVGDAGATDASDYTVLGDAVNYGARLESANKPFGTSTLISRRGVELGADGFLLRPVGKLAVVGRQEKEPEMTYEVLARKADASPRQMRQAALSQQAVDHFVAGMIKDCIATLDTMDAELGTSKYSAIYRAECQRLLKEGLPPDWDGEFILSQK